MALTGSAYGAQLNWLNASGGNFEDPSNWSANAVPGIDDVPIFAAAPAGYIVSFSQDAQVSQIYVFDAVNFDLGGSTLTTTGIPSLGNLDFGLNLNGNLGITNGTVLSPVQNIIESSTLFLSGASTNFTGPLTLTSSSGPGGGGTVRVTDGATLTTSDVNVSYGGFFFILGSGSTWLNTGSVLFERDGYGSVLVSDGGVVQNNSDVYLMGKNVSVSGISGNSRSSFSSHDIYVGHGSTGFMGIASGAIVTGHSMTVASAFGGQMAQVVVGQASGSYSAELDLSSDLNLGGGLFDDNVGLAGPYDGSLVVNAGGKVSTPVLTIGTNKGIPSFIDGSGEADINGGTLTVGTLNGVAGVANLWSGLLQSTGNETFSGNFTFDQYGGVHLLQSLPSGTAAATLQTLTIQKRPGYVATYVLMDGCFQGNVINNDTFSYGGGSFTGDFTNNSTGVLAIGGGGIRTINGNVTSGGSVQISGAALKVTGTFTNTGSITTDNSSIILTTLVMGPGGYINSAGGSFSLTGDLLNSSTQNISWNTARAKLSFSGDSGTSHTLSVDGTDMGISLAGYTNNFSWGTLELGPGQSLILVDGNQTPGGAMYVESLQLDDGLSQVNSIISNGLRIYYDRNLAANAYLNGETFFTADGGTIQPVPEPATSVLLLSSALAVLGRRRRVLRDKI